MEFISDSIASWQLAASVASIASCYVVGSPASLKNRPGEYAIQRNRYVRKLNSAEFDRVFGFLVHSGLVEDYVRISDDLMSL
jgi:hypothetical protein